MLISLPLASLAGCAMCCSPFDYSYPTYGGKWQRVDREHGRVGSVFTPHAGVKVEEGEAAGGVIDGEIIEGEIIEGEYLEGEYPEGEIIEGSIQVQESIEGERSVRLMRPAQ